MAGELDLARAALLVVDAQNDLLHPDGALVRAGYSGAASDALLDRWRELIATARRRDRPVVWVRTALRGDALDSGHADAWLGERRAAAGPFLVEGSWGADALEELPEQEGDFLLYKKGHSAFTDTALDRMLKNLGVEQCLVVGGGAEDSIAETARTGGRLGYEIFVVQDALFPAEANLRMVRSAGELVTSADVLAANGPAASRERPEYALVLVDMQNDFMNNDSAHVRIGLTAPTEDAKRLRIIQNTQRVLAAVRERGWPVIWVRVVRRGDNLDDVHTRTHRRLRTVPAGETHCVEGTPGAEIVAELPQLPGEFLIEKKGGSSFGYTPLHRILRNLGTLRLLVTGGAVLGCVWATVQDGLALGYDITVVGDATYPADNSGLEILAQWCPVRPAEEVVAELGPVVSGT